MTISREVLSRCLPFALYMAIMALSPWLAELNRPGQGAAELAVCLAGGGAAGCHYLFLA
jgi:hypothetical protein